MDRTLDIMIPPKSGHEGGRDDAAERRVTLVGVTSGLAAGRNLHVKGNAQIEWWTIFTTLDQLDTCLADDSLQFQDPILFARVRREFEHVKRHRCARDVNSRSRPSAELCGAGS